jgi:hypothetical protein
MAAERIDVAHFGAGSVLNFEVQFIKFHAPAQQTAVIISKLLQVG